MIIPLDQTIGLEVLDPILGRDIRSSIMDAISHGAVMKGGKRPVAVFRAAVGHAIRKIEQTQGGLANAFLRPGPYPDFGAINQTKHRCIPDSVTVKAVNFIFGGMMNAFKGALAELLAAGPVARLLDDRKRQGVLPPNAVLFLGDAVSARQQKTGRKAKAADIHIIELNESSGTFDLCGVGEVKSYRHSGPEVLRQLEKHVERATGGLFITNREYKLRTCGRGRVAVRIKVVPSGWTLSRQFGITTEDGHTWCVPESESPPSEEAKWTVSDGIDVLTLRWSREALESAAYGCTFWYMAELGKRLYAADVPEEWQGMSPAEAGQNAVKQSLYAAIMRCPKRSAAEQKAIALYNTYGFGYALGMNFRGESGRREMLFFEDLDEILSRGYSVLRDENGQPVQKRVIRGFVLNGEA